MTHEYTLSNGVKIPSIGFGTWQAPDGDVATEAVKCALRSGYRHIDTAAAYDNEKSVGRGIAESGIPRDEIFVTSKVWNTERGYDTTLRAFDKSLADLGLDYLDLYLIHWPATAHQFEDWELINTRTWQAMERLYSEGRVRAIGVSNFLPHHLKPLIDSVELAPMVNQIELHPGWMQHDCVTYCREMGIQIEAWSPLGRGRVLSDPTVLAIAEAHDKSTAQVCLRWELQHGWLPLPKSVTPSRIRENLDVFDFELTAEQMQAIDSMAATGQSGLDPDTVGF
ncbi:MAG: aldo/keto reductase [Candidatus Amulumruptor caecigallinarius]|nr:aldo/keto reductase [Candidatus Amulumruptor caecigallinarius]MCM1397720.1 aldo/keto reductase [Candidatus Amulumruptor caecigallinarius]MCM1454630.1 aldo/keto reductase [bacterium]